VAKNAILTSRQSLIDAALRCLATGGYQSASVRAITKAAGVTPGLLRYYFEEKSSLMLEAYRQFKRDALAAYLQAAADAGPEPARQLKAFTRSVLLFNAADRSEMNIWVSFQELVITDAEVAAAQAEHYDLFLEALAGWITDIYAGRGEQLMPGAVRKLAIGVNSVIDGVRLECSLNPSRMTPEEALEIALDMIGAKLGVAFAELG
jgi:AcrR family transcriptional regulator